MEKLFAKPSAQKPNQADAAPPAELTTAQLQQVTGGLNPQPLPPGRYADHD